MKYLPWNLNYLIHIHDLLNLDLSEMFNINQYFNWYLHDDLLLNYFLHIDDFLDLNRHLENNFVRRSVQR